MESSLQSLFNITKTILMILRLEKIVYICEKCKFSAENWAIPLSYIKNPETYYHNSTQTTINIDQIEDISAHLSRC